MDDETKPLTPSQTIGPFFHPALEWLVDVPAPSAADAAVIEGVLLDGQGAGVSDAAIEVWIPGTTGAPDANSGTFQRVYTGEHGRFAIRLRTDRPLAVGHVTIFARGLLKELRTRVYLADSVQPLKDVPELRSVDENRLETLLAIPGDAPNRFAWIVHLQGERETVFFELA